MNIVLLRGLVREKEHWGDFRHKVEKAFPEAKIITPEIQGVGDYIDITSPDNFSQMIDFMRSNHQEVFESEQQTIVMAMSLGGMIARQWIEMYPQDFSKVILVNTSFKGINPLFNRLRPMAIANFAKIFFSPSIEKRESSIVKMVSNNNTNHKEIIANWIDIQNKRPVKRASFLNQIKAALTFNPPKTWPNNLGLLIIAAKADRLCSYKSSLKLHELWGGQYLEHPTGGHDLPIDDGDWLIQQMSKWIR